MPRSKTSGSFFDEYKMDKVFMILLVLFAVRCIFGLAIGLISETASMNGYDELIARIDYINPLISNSQYHYEAPSWLVDVSLIEIFEFGCYMYCVVIAFGYDLFHSPYPRMLPLVIVIEFIMYNAYRLSEIVGSKLVWLIVFGIAIVALGIYVGTTIAASPLIAATLYFTGAGAVISSIITTILLPILSVVIIISSIIDFLS